MGPKARAEKEFSSVSGFELRLREAIEKSGGVPAVALASGVASTTIYDYQKGKEATFSRISNIARACNVSLDWLADGSRPFGKFEPKELSSPPHYSALVLLVSSAREFHEKMNLHPTLADIFDWIATYYGTYKESPDNPLDIIRKDMS